MDAGDHQTKIAFHANTTPLEMLVWNLVLLRGMY